MKHGPFFSAAGAVVAALVVVGAPLFWFRFCQAAPDSVSVSVLCDGGVSATLDPGDGGKPEAMSDTFVGKVGGGGGASHERHLCRFVSSGRLSPSSCSFSLAAGGGAPAAISVARVTFRKHGFFEFSFRPGTVVSGDGGVLVPPRAPGLFGWRFSPNFPRWPAHDKVSLAVVAAAVLLLAATSRFRSLRGSRRFPAWREALAVAAVAFCSAFFFAFVLPFSSFLANREAFGFPAAALVAQLAARFAASFVATFLCLVAAWPALGWVPALALQGFLVYEWLEVGLFSADFPRLAGSADFFHNVRRMAFDFAFLAGLPGLAVAFGKWVRPHLHWVALSLSLLFAASLADTRVSDGSGGAEGRDPCVRPCAQVLDDAFFSGNGDVLFFVLDAIDAKVAEEAVQANPEWLDDLRGFVAFTNNVGMYSHTSYGVPGILTGIYADKPRMTAAYPASAIGTNAFFRQYADAGVPVFTLQSGLGVGWSNITNSGDFASPAAAAGGDGAATPRRRADPLHERTSAEMAWNVEELCVFRALPFFEKALCLSNFRRVWDYGMALTPPEGDLFAKLRKSPVRADVPRTLHFHHSKGGHIPFVRDRNGGTRHGPDDMEGYFGQSCYALGEAAAFMRHLRETGVYGRALVVLLADHGLTYEHFRDVERNAHPFLWVKAPGADAPFARSGVPTSHSKVHLLARESFGRDLSPQDVERLLAQPEGRVHWTLERRVEYDPHFYDAAGRPVQSR